MIKPLGSFKLRIDIGSMDFSCAQLFIYGDKCERIHGHNYQVAVELEGDLNEDHCVADFRDVKDMLRNVCKRLDEHMLAPTQNPQIQVEHVGANVVIRFQERRYVLPRDDVIFLDLPNISTEMLAFHICGEMRCGLIKEDTNITAISVEIKEKPGQSIIYREVIRHA